MKLLSINSRIKEVRTTLTDLNQKDFGKRIAVGQGYLSQIEKGDRDVTEKILKLVCSEFKVNETWLRTGKGDMVIETDFAIIEQLAKKHGLDTLDQQILLTYIELTESNRSIFKKYLLDLFTKMASAKIHKPPTNNDNSGTDNFINTSNTTQESIDEAVKAYRKELEAEALGQISQVSENTDKNTMRA